MTRGGLLSIYVAIDLAIVAAVVWCFFQRIPAGRFLVPAIILFVANGLWLVIAMVRNEPDRSS